MSDFRLKQGELREMVRSASGKEIGYARNGDSLTLGDAKLWQLHYFYFEGRFVGVEMTAANEKQQALVDAVEATFGPGRPVREPISIEGWPYKFKPGGQCKVYFGKSAYGYLDPEAFLDGPGGRMDLTRFEIYTLGYLAIKHAEAVKTKQRATKPATDDL